MDRVDYVCGFTACAELSSVETDGVGHHSISIAEHIVAVHGVESDEEEPAEE